MFTVSHTSGLNESWRQTPSGSAFPPALPPRHPAAGINTVPPLIRDGDGEAMMQHPLITAADYSDRKRLLSHISLLSCRLQRAELLLRNASRTMVSDEELARFDPLVAQGHIERLESALAQVGLLREVELGRIRALEEELQGLRLERNRLVERVDVLDSRASTLEADNKRLDGALSSAQLEVERLRTEETKLHRRLETIDKLQEDGGQYKGVNVIVAPPRQSATWPECGRILKELQMQETVGRMALLLDMMMEPICIAFDAGVVWMTETQLHRASVSINDARVPEVVNNNEGMPTIVEGNSPLGQADDDTLPPTAHDVKIINREKLLHELEAEREKRRMVEQQGERIRQLLHKEQQRTEMMAKEHYQQLQRVHDQVVHERRHIMESLMGEVEEKMRNAFRDGRLHEKRLADERRQKRKSIAGHTNHNLSAATKRRSGKLTHATLRISGGRVLHNNSCSSSSDNNNHNSDSESGSSGSGGVRRIDKNTSARK